MKDVYWANPPLRQSPPLLRVSVSLRHGSLAPPLRGSVSLRHRGSLAPPLRGSVTRLAGSVLALLLRRRFVLEGLLLPPPLLLLFLLWPLLLAAFLLLVRPCRGLLWLRSLSWRWRLGIAHAVAKRNQDNRLVTLGLRHLGGMLRHHECEKRARPFEPKQRQ